MKFKIFLLPHRPSYVGESIWRHLSLCRLNSAPFVLVLIEIGILILMLIEVDTLNLMLIEVDVLLSLKSVPFI